MHKHILFSIAMALSCSYCPPSNAGENSDMTMSGNLRASEALAEAQGFFHSGEGLNLDLSSSHELAKKWSARKECESGRYIRKVIAAEFKRTYESIRTFGRIGLSPEDARAYASEQVAQLTRCGDLIRR